MMSRLRCVNSGARMCSMFASEPVSRLSTQMTRSPRRNSSSHRCDPRKPAPPVTRQVAMPGESIPRLREDLAPGRRPRSAEVLALARRLPLLRPRGDLVAAAGLLGEPGLGEAAEDDRATLAARTALAAALLGLDLGSHRS